MYTHAGASAERLHASPSRRRTQSDIAGEILLIIFTICGFYDRFSLSQVCQHWRRVALASSYIWTSICCRDANPPAKLLALALERSSPLPVDLELLHYNPVSGIIHENFSRLRSLISRDPDDLIVMKRSRYTGYFSAHATIQRAPLLEYLCMRGEMAITQQFLGGAGRLRRLETVELSLPDSCPALRSLTHLRVDCSGIGERHFELDNLFHLCPVLHSLAISGLITASMPTSPAPPTLSSVSIGAVYDSPDICRTVRAWKSPALASVSLTFYDGGIPEDISTVLAHAIDLRIRVPAAPIIPPARDGEDFPYNVNPVPGDALGMGICAPGQSLILLVRDEDHSDTEITLVECTEPDKFAAILSACTTRLASLRVPRSLTNEVLALVSAPVEVVFEE